MPIYVPDSSNVLKELSSIMVTTPDNVVREIAEGWHTGEDKVNRLVYQNEVYLMQNGKFNPEIISGYIILKYGSSSKVEEVDGGIKIHGERGSKDVYDEGYTYVVFKHNDTDDVNTQSEYLYSLIKNKSHICFDVYIYCTVDIALDYVFGWVGFNPYDYKNKNTGLRIYKMPSKQSDFSGILQIDTKSISLDDLSKIGLNGMPLGAGAYCRSPLNYVEMTIKNIWIE